MSLKDFNILRNIINALKSFFREDGLDKSCVLAYYSIFSTLFLLTFFTFLFAKLLGDPDIPLKTILPFSPDFFAQISPDIMTKAGEISMKFKEIGVVGVLFSFLFGFLIIKKIVQYVNAMFHVNLRDHRSDRHFLVRRISEFGLLFIIGLLVVVTFLFNGVISTLTTLSYKNRFFGNYINPGVIEAFNHFMVKYVLPFIVSFLFFLVLYKWIPEKVIYLKGAVISALLSAILWELGKRGYTYYLVNISIFGKLKGPIIGIILYGFWMEISMGIMLFGAKLTYFFDEEKHAKTRLVEPIIKR